MRVNRNYVLTEYVLNKNDCTRKGVAIELFPKLQTFELAKPQ